MKTYFYLPDFFYNSFNANRYGIDLISYKIDDVETLTADFNNETQAISAFPLEDYFFCFAQATGADPQPNTTLGTANSFNPFVKHLGLTYPLINGLPRGLPTGTTSGSDYGEGVMNIGVDIPRVKTANDAEVDIGGAFFIDIDYSRNLEIELNLVMSIGDEESPYENPYIYYKAIIRWDIVKCSPEYLIYATTTNDAGELVYFPPLDWSNYGFLNGTLPKDEGDPKIDFSQIPCAGVPTSCPDKQRTIAYALFVEIPQEEPEAETIKECCYGAVVFADADSNVYEKNDFTGVFHQKQIPTETAEFILVDLSDNTEITLDDNTLGTFRDFGDIAENPDLSYFVLNWRQVLLTYGTGNYTIVKRVTIAGFNFEQSDINYSLKNYSNARADKTVRLEIKMDGYLERLGTDFKNSGYVTSLRFGGFFGRRQPKFEEDNIIYANFESTQISMKQRNEFLLQSDLLPFCITSQIYDFCLFANDIYVTDYNFNNHIRNFIKFPVKLAESKEIGYFNTTTKAIVNLSFSEKFINNIKRNY